MPDMPDIPQIDVPEVPECPPEPLFWRSPSLHETLECLPGHWPSLGTSITLHHSTGTAIKCELQLVQSNKPRPVFFLKSSTWSLDWLYGLAEKYSLWWRLLDRLRYRIPHWFIPHEAIFKLYTPEKSDDAYPYERAQTETDRYHRLQEEQGRWIPRHYGWVVWDFQIGAILERVPGQPLNIANVNVDRILRDLPLIVKKLNAANVLGDLDCTNLIDDGKQLWYLDLDISFETGRDYIQSGNNEQLQRFMAELKEWQLSSKLDGEKPDKT